MRIMCVIRSLDNSDAARDAMRVETDEVVAVLHKSRPDAPIPEISEASFAALNAIISLPPSNAPQRARWPRGIVLDADPVCTAKIINDAEGTPAVCLAFDSEDCARVWCWKLNYDVFYGEGAGMPHIQNMVSTSAITSPFTRRWRGADAIDRSRTGLPGFPPHGEHEPLHELLHAGLPRR